MSSTEDTQVEQLHGHLQHEGMRGTVDIMDTYCGKGSCGHTTEADIITGPHTGI